MLNDMVVAVHNARHAWSIGNDSGDLIEVDTVEAEGDVLQIGGVMLVGIDFSTCSVIGYQVYLCLHTSVSCHEDVIVLVERELFVTYSWPLRYEVQLKPAVNHLCLHA